MAQLLPLLPPAGATSELVKALRIVDGIFCRVAASALARFPPAPITFETRGLYFAVPARAGR